MRAVASSVVCLCLLLLGCESGWDKRKGIPPIIDPSSVESSTSNQLRILNALAQDAGLTPDYPYYYYNVTVAGFNYIDDQCNQYFDTLFFLNREKDQLKTGLTAAGATTAAIMAATKASATSIAVVAQAFGLGVVATDVVAGTFLYQVTPATARGFVHQLQSAFRDGAATRYRLINSPAMAYHTIQEYLSLCLPPTIEAKIAEHVANAKVVADPPTAANSASIGLTVVTPPPITRAQLQAAIIKNVNAPLPPPIRQPATVAPDRLTTFEQHLLPSELATINKVLCGPLGPKGSATREVLHSYLVSINRPNPGYVVTGDVMVLLERLERDGKTANCAPQ